MDARTILNAVTDRDLPSSTRLVAVCGLLSTGPHTSTSLADTLGLSRRTTAEALARLERRGLVVRRYEMDYRDIPRPAWLFIGAANRPMTLRES
ncbi:MarR family transcriptional regulator [Actinacidiphila oryziradicis]|uniref:MarR family transcriptional regulator n=1 Tax=Actinacidiphila oryziradicis TaxID=2571141 RepID=A0A4V5MX59_9ACTN|nr:MarR family transcriptional regulator [Actinacidiphila oryziradicis]TJZ98988.1 MarR family transcriptional regulator [Actinacidiphila oryziradicis]